MKLTIELNMDNDAFSDGHSGYEAARILQNLTVGWNGTELAPGESWNLHDSNGNTVGSAEVSDTRARRKPGSPRTPRGFSR